MDWTLYISHNRDALLRLVASLFALVGLVEGGSVSRLPRSVQRAVLFILRPAESALRRLIFALSRGMPMPVYRPRPAPNGDIPRGDGSGERVPPFQLFDPRKSFPELSQGGRRPKPGQGPRILFFDGYDDPPEPEPEKPLRDPDDAAALIARLMALQNALQDMDGQARRLLRAMAKRAAARPGPKRYQPLRSGSPPGHRARGTHEIDEILRDCHEIALHLRAAHDTS